MNDTRDVYLVTGSSGLIGHSLCHYFGNKDNLIVGFDNEGPPYPPPNSVCFFCDLTDDESVQKTMYMVKEKFGNKIKAVFHLAAYYSFEGKDSHLYKDLTVDGTRRMLRELQEFEVGQFIFSSSMLIYRPNLPGQRLTEQSPIEPTWQYPQSKVDCEEMMQEVHGKVPVVSLRIAGVYSDLCQSIPIAHQIQRIYERKMESHLYSGSIGVRQSFIHLSDLISSFEAAVDAAGTLPAYSVFNIGEEDAMSYEEMQNEIGRDLYGEDWPTIQVPKPIAKAGAWVEEQLPGPEKPFIKPWMIDRADDNYELNIAKARNVLGWETKHSLSATLPKMLELLKNDPLKWYSINKLTPPHWLKQQKAS